MSEARALLDRQTRRITREEYHRMVDAGLFAGERVELLRGRVVTMAPQSAPHAGVVEAVNEALAPQLVGRARLRPQLPFLAVDDSEPEPDIAVVAGGDRFTEHPSSAYLLIEVAVSSFPVDRAVKAPLYGETAVGEYWIVDVDGRRAIVHRAPVDGVYTDVTEVHADADDAVLEAQALPGVTVRLADVLPPA